MNTTSFLHYVGGNEQTRLVQHHTGLHIHTNQRLEDWAKESSTRRGDSMGCLSDGISEVQNSAQQLRTGEQVLCQYFITFFHFAAG